MKLPNYLLTCCVFLMIACDAGDSSRMVTRARMVPPQDRPPVAMSDAERFGLDAEPAAAAPAKSSNPFDFTLPRGWSIAAPKPMRDLNLTIAGAPDLECYVMTLSRDGGGLEANINRWREQMGLGPIAQNDFSKLEKIQVLDTSGTIVDLRGTYRGMDDQAHSDYGLIGVICALPDRTVFIKMIGPADQVTARRNALLQFSQSLKSNP